MSNNSQAARSGGIGFGGLLTVLFVGLKLTHYINWSWWLVTAPLWGPALLIIVVAIVAAAIVVLFGK